MKEDRIGTPYVEVLSHKFCAYCLEPMKLDSGYDDGYYYWEENYCDCDKAKEHDEFVKNIKLLQNKLNWHEGLSYFYNKNSDKFKKWETKKKVEILSKEIKLLEELNAE